MKRGTLHSAVLREDQKVFSPIGFSVFPLFIPFTALVSEAVFLRSHESAGSGEAPYSTCPEKVKFFNMRNNDEDSRVAQFILGQEDIRDCVPFLINRENII